MASEHQPPWILPPSPKRRKHPEAIFQKRVEILRDILEKDYMSWEQRYDVMRYQCAAFDEADNLPGVEPPSTPPSLLGDIAAASSALTPSPCVEAKPQAREPFARDEKAQESPSEDEPCFVEWAKRLTIAENKAKAMAKKRARLDKEAAIFEVMQWLP